MSREQIDRCLRTNECGPIFHQRLVKHLWRAKKQTERVEKNARKGALKVGSSVVDRARKDAAKAIKAADQPKASSGSDPAPGSNESLKEAQEKEEVEVVNRSDQLSQYRSSLWKVQQEYQTVC